MLSVKWRPWLLVVGSLVAVSASAQIQARPLVTQAIDETRLVTLKGSVHPLVRAGNDRGAVPDSFAAEGMILLLNGGPDRDAALERFLENAHTRGSADYHAWLTPEQFGEQFGAADSDIQAATGWLGSHGFSVLKTSKSKRFIVFSGTAGGLRQAFHTEIHRYSLNGRTEFANASEISIPAALAPWFGAFLR